VITGERGNGQLTRNGLEEYVSDCVIVLDHRVIDQISTRRLRIVKYRGTTHGTNEYPFLIGDEGVSVVPITSLGLQHDASTERVSTGIPAFDAMFGGKGYYRGSSVLISGTAGTGKSSIAIHFADAACRRGETCLYLAFEESPGQILRNMRSIGIELEPWVKKNRLHFHAIRSTLQGLETHLATFHKLVVDIEPDVVVFDPVDSLVQAGTLKDATAMLTRLIDFLKVDGITTVMTNLISSSVPENTSGVDVSSLVDTWVLLRDVEHDRRRTRYVNVLKSRGMAHSTGVHQMAITDNGIKIAAARGRKKPAPRNRR
jgi:circadian clock protein KaiC